MIPVKNACTSLGKTEDKERFFKSHRKIRKEISKDHIVRQNYIFFNNCGESPADYKIRRFKSLH